MKTEVNCIVCPTCKDIIYSRTRHDFRWCSCGEIAVDGGFDYLKMSYKTVKPEIVVREVDVSKEELYHDWNFKIDQFGLIKPLTKQIEQSIIKPESGNDNTKGYIMSAKKNTTKKANKAKVPKKETPVSETVNDPEKGSTVRVRNSGL